jgi:hypothetical protein
VLTAGQVDSGNDFGNFQQATKTGVKFNDLNADGVRDMGENGLPDWVIFAYHDDNGDGLLQLGEQSDGVSTTTDASGVYSFTLDPGQYIVVEGSMADWVQTFPTTDVVDTGTGVEQGGYAITLTSGQIDSGNDFGNHQEVAAVGLTPGFWCNHLYVWDGIEDNGPTDGQGRFLADKLAEAGVIEEPEILDLLPGNLDVDGDGKKDLMFEANGKCLIIEWDDAQEIICQENGSGPDKLDDFTKFAITTLLNDSGVPDFDAPNDLIGDIADWLLQFASTSTDPDAPADCMVLNYNNAGEPGSDGFPTQIRANSVAWQTGDADTPAGSEIFAAMTALTDGGDSSSLLGVTPMDPNLHLV